MGRVVALLAVAAVFAACSSTSSGDDMAAASGREQGAPIEIGLPHPANLAGLSALFGGALGGNGMTAPTDEETLAIYKSLVDYVNNHGGLLGSKIIPIYYSLDATATAGTATEQEMCTQFTQDHHVFAVMALTNHTDTLVSCLEDAKAITFTPVGPSALDDTYFREHPLYATAGTMSLTRVAALQVNGLFEAGFFGSNAKIGLVGYDSEPFTRAIDKVLKPALAGHGLTLADQQLVKPVSGVQDVGATQQAIANAVLRFKEKGIDHVLFFDTQGGTVTPWTKAATAQKYYPRLGLTTNQRLATRTYAGNETNPDQVNQFSTALAVGWNPRSDVTNPETNTTGKLCNQIMQGAGASAAQAQFFWNICDQLLVFAAGVNAGGELTPENALRGLAAAKDLPNAELLGPPDYSGGRRDGATVARTLSFTASCECFQYNSPPLPARLLTSG